MITIPEVVESIVKSSPFLEEGIQKDIINFSALARQMKPQIEEETMKDVTEGAIVMALKRLSPSIKKKNATKTLFKHLPDMSVRSNLFEYTILNSGSLIQKHKRIFAEMEKQQRYFIVLTQGIFETTIIVSKDLRHKIEAILEGEKIRSRIDDLSAITIRLPENAIETPAMFYTIHRLLAWENINITEVASTFCEFTLILKENDIDRAFSILKNGLK